MDRIRIARGYTSNLQVPDNMSFRLIIDIDRCKGCELCAEVCPRHILAMAQALNTSGSHYPQITAQPDCSGCRRCAIICPEAAIEIELR